MRNLFRFILKHHFVLLFVILEIIAFVLIARNNSYQKSRFVRFRHSITGNISSIFANYKTYLSLREQNQELLKENIHLYDLLLQDRYGKTTKIVEEDTIIKMKFRALPAKVVNMSVNKQNNFMVINKGKLHGIQPEMAVVTSKGIVGIITKDISDNYSTVLSVLNRKFYTSAIIKRIGYYGPLNWDGKSHRYSILGEIPHNAKINIGDTVITSGFSAIFPKGILIGTVKSYQLNNRNFYDVKVELSNDFKKLSDVLIIESNIKEEQDTLIERMQND